MAQLFYRLERVFHTLSSPKSGRQSGLQIRFTHRRLSPSNGRSDFVAHTAGVPPSARWAWRGARWAVGGIGKPERLARWVWIGGSVWVDMGK